MFKNIFLSSLCLLSTIATAHIELHLDATITRGLAERHIAPTIVVEENVPAIIEQDNMVMVVSAQQIDATTIIVQAELLEKTETDELVSIAQPVIEVVENKEAVITLGNSEGDSLTLSVVFNFVE